MRHLIPALVAALLLTVPDLAWAQDIVPSVGEIIGGVVDTAEGQEVSTSVRLVMILTSMAFLPGMLLLMTPFTRFIIVFALLRSALGLQQSPPNQVLVALALMLSMVVMQPTIQAVQADAIDPYLAGTIDTSEAATKGLAPMRAFMLDHVGGEELLTAMQLGRVKALTAERTLTPDDIPTPVLVTGFVLGELKQAFIIAVKVYVPFLVVDIIIASVLLGMGMMMLPPVIISLPFKLLVFVLMDGWLLLVKGLVESFA